MVIPVLVEPSYAHSIWIRETLDGFGREAAKRKYHLELLPQKYESVNYGALFGDEKKIVILAGASVTYVPKVLDFFSQKGISVILINYETSDSFPTQGMMRMDYGNAVNALLQYLTDCGKKQIALYGVNPNSSADGIKLRAFEDWLRSFSDDVGGSVFYNYASLTNCYLSVRNVIHRFDAFICVNNIVAASLMQRLLADGVQVPESLFVAALGDSLLLRNLKPSVTAVSLDYNKIGSQAVLLYAYLSRQKESGAVSVRVPFTFEVRESTAMMPFSPDVHHVPVHEERKIRGVDFYSDSEVQVYSKADHLLSICDDTDFELLRGILQGETYESIAQRTYMTVDSLKYRKKRMMRAASCTQNEDFSSLLHVFSDLGIIADSK